MHRLTCHFTGRVQGVGFRATARQVVSRFDVTGYVRNLDDGRVEMVLEGSEDETQRAADAVQDRMGAGILRVTRNPSPATNEFRVFSIVH